MTRMGVEGRKQEGTQNVAQQELGYLNRQHPKKKDQKSGRAKTGGCGRQ